MRGTSWETLQEHQKKPKGYKVGFTVSYEGIATARDKDSTSTCR